MLCGGLCGRVVDLDCKEPRREMTVHVAGHDKLDLSQDQIFVRAIRIATNAHRGENGKDGRPYIEHCERVAMRVEPELRPIAYLHDVVEHAESWSLDRLRLDGFPEEMIEAVEALTRRAGETDESLLRRSAANPMASVVRRADLEDNLQATLASGGDAEQWRHKLGLLAEFSNP
jgi:(p)ppGpp synthase/HD superfamily hydrolase